MSATIRARPSARRGLVGPTHLSHGTLMCRDLAASRRFYEEFLGLEVVRHARPSEALELREIDRPEPGPGMVRVRVEAASLNFNDIDRCHGRTTSIPMKPPFTLGMDVCGVVDAAGAGGERWLGRRVVAITQMAQGGLAEHALAAADSVFDAPPLCQPQPTTANVTVAVTSPATYLCHEPYKAKLVLTNGSCASVTVQNIAISGMVTAGACSPPGPGNFNPVVSTVAAGQSVTILDTTTGPFCCTSPGCPASFQCDERFTLVVTSSAGMLTTTNMSHLSLDSCSEVCTP